MTSPPPISPIPATGPGSARKFDGSLPEDGRYYGTVKKAEAKSTDKGHEIFEITTVVDEGEFAGREVTQSIFYYVPGKDDASLRGMKNVRTLAERSNPALAEMGDIGDVIVALESELLNRKVSFEQKTSPDGKYKNIWHHDVFDRVEEEVAF